MEPTKSNGRSIALSVVLPCLNEEEGIAACLSKIRRIFDRYGINGEIIVADNGSTDRSPEIAESFDARVVYESRRGYGAAYLCGLRHARGKFIIIGDSDDTYNFNDIPKFLKPLEEGYDFVMGSRFKGAIQQGAMSWSHRYIGNPILSAMCRLFFRTALSDIHCGMRAFTAEAYRRMRLSTLGMEFATEMVVSALSNHLKIYEIPIDYHPRAGSSKLNAFLDAWRHIRFMLVGCPVWLYLVPGTTGFLFGFTLLFLLARGPFLFLGRHWDIHVMVFASMLSILSYQLLTMGVSAHAYAVRQGFLRSDPATGLFLKHFNIERGLMIGGALSLVGVSINAFIFFEWFSSDFGALHRIRESILAMTLLVIGIQTIFASFFMGLFFVERK
ncbi:MAG: glycosyltransferase family 2 protein [Candidatus Omnitrophica bacterium]|nr:glycosyltransferase family 2 protein [Candidatus Omnitrophota bacterium]